MPFDHVSEQQRAWVTTNMADDCEPVVSPNTVIFRISPKSEEEGYTS